MIRRSGSADLPAALAGAAMLAWSAIAVGAWVVVAALGVLAAAVTTFRWPGTVAAAIAVLAQLAHGPSVLDGLVVGLLVAAYLVLLDGIPRVDGLMPLAVGAALTTSVVLAVLLWAVRPSVWWVLAASVAAPLTLLLASSGLTSPSAGSPSSGPRRSCRPPTW
ncbi:MAG: hypothetical protein ACRDRO_11180 [Pseudonocardiaceae bacterium]